MKQSKCFERWLGQTIYRSITPTFGNFSGRNLGYKRGTVIKLFKDEFQRCNVEVLWEVDINERTGEIKKEKYCSNYFDWGVCSLFELEILARGGLLSLKESKGCFLEEQCKSLIEIIPLIKSIIENPAQDFFPNIGT